MDIYEAQKEYVERFFLRVGSKVKFLKKFDTYEVIYNGQPSEVKWTDGVEQYVGQEGKISKIGHGWLNVEFNTLPGTSWFPIVRFSLPYHSLQPIYDDSEVFILENLSPALINKDGSTLINGLSVTFEELQDLFLLAGKALQKNKSNGEIDDGSEDTWKDSNNKLTLFGDDD